MGCSALVALVELVGCELQGGRHWRRWIWAGGELGGWVEVLFARLSDVSAIGQLRLSVDAKPVSLGEPLLTAAEVTSVEVV